MNETGRSTKHITKKLATAPYKTQHGQTRQAVLLNTKRSSGINLTKRRNNALLSHILN